MYLVLLIPHIRLGKGIQLYTSEIHNRVHKDQSYSNVGLDIPHPYSELEVHKDQSYS
jgi:hypothetical protein